MNLGENIYKLRTEKNLSQGGLADALEVSRQSVSKWENNSAVPELDKLVKMAEIFGVTIDELVTGNPPETTAPEQPEPKVIYIEKPDRPGITGPQILGTILLSCSLLCFVLFACFGSRRDLTDVFMLCLPVAICGILCLVTKHPMLWCGWGFSATYWIYVFILSYSWEDEAFLLILGVLLVLAVLLYTVRLHKKGTIHVPAWLWAALALALSAAALLLMLSLLPPAEGVVTPVKPIKVG